MDKIEHLCYNRGMNDITPKYILLETDADGNERRQYRDGSIRNQNGQLLVKPDYDLPVITSDNAHEYLKQRKQKILDAIEAKVMDITKTRLPSDAIGAIVGKRAEIAMKDETRTGNEAAKIVLQALDAYQIRQDNSTNVLRNEIVIDDNTRALLERIAQMKHDGKDGEVIDV